MFDESQKKPFQMSLTKKWEIPLSNDSLCRCLSDPIPKLCNSCFVAVVHSSAFCLFIIVVIFKICRAEESSAGGVRYGCEVLSVSPVISPGDKEWSGTCSWQWQWVWNQLCSQGCYELAPAFHRWHVGFSGFHLPAKGSGGFDLCFLNISNAESSSSLGESLLCSVSISGPESLSVSSANTSALPETALPCFQCIKAVL